MSWLVLANAAIKPLWLLYLTVACTRLLGADEYGIMMAAWGLGLLAAFIPDAGSTQLTARDVAQQPDQAALYFTNFMVWRFGASTAGWVLTLGAGWILGYRGPGLACVAWAGVYMVAQELRAFSRSFFEATLRARTEALLFTLERSLVILFGMMALWWSRQAWATLAGMSLGMAVAAAVSTLILGQRNGLWRWSLASAPFLRNALRSGLVLGLLGLLGLLYYRSDTIIVERLLGQADAGQYGLSYQMLVGANMLPTIIVTSVSFPRLSRLWRDGAHHRYHRLAAWVSLVLIAVGAGVAGFVMLTAETLVGLLSGGSEFAPAAEALEVLIWAFPFGCLHLVLTSMMIIQHRHRSCLVVLLAAALLNIGLTYLLVPHHGIVAAAWVTVAGEAAMCLSYALILAWAHSRSVPQATPACTS